MIRFGKRTCAAVGLGISVTMLAGVLQATPAVIKADEPSAPEYATQPDCGLPASGYPKEGTYKDNLSYLDDVYSHAEKDALNAELNAPLQYIDRWGFLVQPTASDPLSWNNTYLNADNRGCNACHTLEDALMSLPTYHRLIFMGYPQPQTVANCLPCHSGHAAFKDTIHTLHMGKPSFDNMNTSCESCHYIGEDGEFLNWDYYKYDAEVGIIEVDADAAAIEVSYDQDTISTLDEMYFKTIRSEPIEWLTDDEVVDEAIAENWVISFTGDIENPCDLTLPELIEMFGTKTAVMKSHCTINGVGNATIYQAEVGGIDLQKLVEYLQPKEGCNLIRPFGDDGYHASGFANAIPLQYALDNDGMLVTEMNGVTLPNTQGYPVAFWLGSVSAGDNVKRVAAVNFETVDPEKLSDPYVTLGIGKYYDSVTGELAAKPNSGVLNLPNGIVLADQVGNPLHLEGFADAFNEPITLMEFSLDKGKTWTEMEVVNADTERWVYWRLDYTPQEAGSHLLTIRTTSLAEDGGERTCTYDTQFLFNVE